MQKIANFLKESFDNFREWISSFTEMIQTVVDFVVSVFEKLKDMIRLIHDALATYTGDVIGFAADNSVPAIVITICVVATILWISTRIAGRE